MRKRSGAIALVVLVVAVASGPRTSAGERRPTELVFSHINDLFAEPDAPDDRYTGTISIGALHRGVELTLTEYLFTDRHVTMSRFDETYLTVAHDFTPGAWVVSGRAGAVHVGRGLYGQRFQNFIHRLVDQRQLDLSYVEQGWDLLLGVRASRPLVRREHFTLAPYVEGETAGFKRHALVGIDAKIPVAAQFDVLADVGYRWTSTNFDTLDRFVAENEIAYGAGFSFRRWFEMRWTYNWFGTAERHWHLLWRIPVKSHRAEGIRED